MVISIAFFGLGGGSFLVYIVKDRVEKRIPSTIAKASAGFAISIAIFLVLVSDLPSKDSSIIYIVASYGISEVYLFYLVSSVPFFFAGIAMASIFLALPRKISKLYFFDLVGASFAALLFDSFMQELGAESVLLMIGILALFPTIIAAAYLLKLQKSEVAKTVSQDTFSIQKRILASGLGVIAGCAILLLSIQTYDYFQIQPGAGTKTLTKLQSDPSIEHVTTNWNSFSRVDSLRYLEPEDPNHRGRLLSSIIIDGDAGTPVFRWNGSDADLVWLRKYMDFLPYEISRDQVNNTLVIGSGGGEDILVALAGKTRNVTAVEINPLIVSAAKSEWHRNASTSLYETDRVNVVIDDGRRFIGGTDFKYDIIVLKLIDSWAAQLAGGYALSENYLYTVEAFKEFLDHLEGNDSMLVLIRWNTELPKIMPLIAKSLREHVQDGSENKIEDISRRIMVVENKPTPFFEGSREIYPVIILIKNSEFSEDQIRLAEDKASMSDARVFLNGGNYSIPPYKLILASADREQQQRAYTKHFGSSNSFQLQPPTDNSPFYFAKQQIPEDMVQLLVTVMGVSAILVFLLILYLAKVKKNRIEGTEIPQSQKSFYLYVIFAASIGFGFMFLEITFIQRFLLLLGTPIMALMVILFSILLSSGIGSYLSGRIFSRPNLAVIYSVPPLVLIILVYNIALQPIIDVAITLPVFYRILIAFAFLFPPGLLMGFQFPSIIRMAAIQLNDNRNTTLIWGINVIASVIGTVLAAISSMVIGFSGNLLIGALLYVIAMCSVIALSLKDRIVQTKNL
jgi:hypothetical protein